VHAGLDKNQGSKNKGRSFAVRTHTSAPPYRSNQTIN